MKILIFIGTRPELIKLYPLILELKKDKSKKIKICFTGQHDFLLKKILKEFKVNPNYILRCKNNTGNLNILSSKLYKKSIKPGDSIFIEPYINFNLSSASKKGFVFLVTSESSLDLNTEKEISSILNPARIIIDNQSWFEGK